MNIGPIGGSPKADLQRGDRRSERIEAERDLILGIAEQSRDMALTELQAELSSRGHSFAVATLWRFFDRNGITWKKTPHSTEQDRPDILKRRQDWFDHQLDFDPERLVFIDETWTSTNMVRGRGR